MNLLLTLIGLEPWICPLCGKKFHGKSHMACGKDGMHGIPSGIGGFDMKVCIGEECQRRAKEMSAQAFATWDAQVVEQFTPRVMTWEEIRGVEIKCDYCGKKSWPHSKCEHCDAPLGHPCIGS